MLIFMQEHQRKEGIRNINRYAYVRVSTKTQNVDRQIIALRGYDIPKKNIFCGYQ